MQLGMSTAAYFGRWETEDSARAISRLPLDCAEVFLQTSSEYTRDFAQLVRNNLGDMPCVSVHPLGTLFENQLISRSVRQRRDAFDVLRRVLDAGAALGAKYYIHHGRHTPRNEKLPWNLSANAELLALIGEAARARGMTVAWENVDWCQLTTADRVREARDMLPDMHYTLDIKQAMKAGADPIELARAMGERLVHVHICDWDKNRCLCLPGEGVFDFDGLIRALHNQGYRGAVILEPYLSLIKNDEALERSIARMRYIIEGVTRNEQD
ncbi:MAG: sugar phosphate isomerase/epimerase [Eubacteriales bacterium]|nr:sugar phosphate isomerase/epimerase [Eubacteriales bacterium]